MAFIRRHGNQLALVHGVRDPETRKVRQRVLFSLYSKAEALEALGKGTASDIASFEQLLEGTYPQIRFDWPKIRAQIEDNLDHLPDLYPYRTAKLRDRFREDLVVLVRQLLLADPQMLVSAADVVREHQAELTYLRELIDWRLKIIDREESEASQDFGRDNPFYWRLRLQGTSVPYEAEEEIGSLYEKGEHDKVEVLARLLLDCFPDYADGHNYLGLVAMDRGDLPAAIGHFRKTMEVGRTLFPSRIAKKRYWTELSTRPYMRGMRNLVLALNRTGEYAEALELADRLDEECGDDLTAASNRAAICLNLGWWEQARTAAKKGVGIWPSEGFLIAFASFELGELEDGRVAWRHAAEKHPIAAKMLLGQKVKRPEPTDWNGAGDYNAGIDLRVNLGGYLGNPPARAQGFLKRLVVE